MMVMREVVTKECTSEGFSRVSAATGVLRECIAATGVSRELDAMISRLFCDGKRDERSLIIHRVLCAARTTRGDAAADSRSSTLFI